MPPRKKQKLSSQGVSTPSHDTSLPTPTQATGATKDDAEYEAIVNDRWTDEQETALLKGVIRWKPVGMHKHFRMLAISEHMRTHGYAPANEQHTRLPGIWKKMGTLYNLEGLDEREDPFPVDPSEAPSPSDEPYCPFELRGDEYGDMMFERRLNPDGSTSPPGSARAASAKPSTIADTDEPRSSPAPSRKGRPRGRGRRSNRGGRSSRLHVEVESSKSRSSEKPSSANEDDEAEAEEGDASATDAAGDGSNAESPAPRSTRTQTGRGKGGRGSTSGRRGGRRR